MALAYSKKSAPQLLRPTKSTPMPRSCEPWPAHTNASFPTFHLSHTSGGPETTPSHRSCRPHAARTYLGFEPLT